MVDASQFQFTEQVTINNDDVTLTLTRRPPRVTVVNGTGHAARIISPLPMSLANGGTFSFFKQSPTAPPLHTITYMVGVSRMQFYHQVSITNNDVTLTLTRRPPHITIVNNTGVTVTNIFIRNSGRLWGDLNLLGFQLNPDGVTVSRIGTRPGELAGSLTNRDSFTIWTGHLEGHIDPGAFDVRLDDTHGVSYVMSNVTFGADITLTFTQAHRP